MVRARHNMEQWESLIDWLHVGDVDQVWGPAILACNIEELGSRHVELLHSLLNTVTPDLFQEAFAGSVAGPMHTAQAASLLRGMIHAVLAGYSVSHENTRSFVGDCIECLNAFGAAWPLWDDSDEPLTKEQFIGDVLIPSDVPKTRGPLQSYLHKLADHIAAAKLPVYAPTWLMLRRLLIHTTSAASDAEIRNQPEGPLASHTRSNILFDVTEGGHERAIGLVVPLEVCAEFRGCCGYYVDPVTVGMAVLDEAMLRSLRAAWARCRTSLRSRIDPDNGVPNVRLSLKVRGPMRVVTGESAGVVFACGLYAAARGLPLDPLASASVALDLDDPRLLLPVANDSIRPKLTAAANNGLQRVALHRDQARDHAALANDLGLLAVEAERLEDAFQVLRGSLLRRVIKNTVGSAVRSLQRAAELGTGFAEFAHASDHVSELSEDAWKTIVLLVAQPCIEMGLSISFPRRQQAGSETTETVRAQIELALAVRNTRLAAVFDFAWRLNAVMIHETALRRHGLVPAQQQAMPSPQDVEQALRESGARAGLVHNVTEQVIRGLAYGEFSPDELDQWKEFIGNWMLDELEDDSEATLDVATGIRRLLTADGDRPGQRQEKRRLFLPEAPVDIVESGPSGPGLCSAVSPSARLDLAFLIHSAFHDPKNRFLELNKRIEKAIREGDDESLGRLSNRGRDLPLMTCCRTSMSTRSLTRRHTDS